MTQPEKCTDERVIAEFLSAHPDATPKEAFLAGLIHERRAAARLAFSINDAMAHAVGRLIRSRARDVNRKQYE